EGDAQPGDREEVREPRARVALAQLGVEVGAARNDERVDERRPLAEEAAAPLADPVAEGTAATRRRIELAQAPCDEDAAIRLAQEAARGDPRCAAKSSGGVWPPAG